MDLFSRKPLSNTEYNRSDHSIVNKTCDSYIIKIPHTRRPGKQDFKANMLAICWCYNFHSPPHITNRGDTHLCRKVTRFYINLQRAGCQSARSLDPARNPTSPHQGVEIWNGLKYKSPKLLFGRYGFVFSWDPTLAYITLKYYFGNVFLPKIFFSLHLITDNCM